MKTRITVRLNKTNREVWAGEMPAVDGATWLTPADGWIPDGYEYHHHLVVLDLTDPENPVQEIRIVMRQKGDR